MRVVSCRVGKIFGVRVSYVLDILVFVFVTCRVEKFDTRPSLIQTIVVQIIATDVRENIADEFFFG